MSNSSPHVLLDNRQMAAADAAAMAAGISGTELMENAGVAVANAIRERWSPRAVLVLCGPGNNGGDGFVIARHLAAAGWKVKLASFGSAEARSADAQYHAGLWKGGEVPFSVDALSDVDLVVDAMLGAGLTRPPDGKVATMIEAINSLRVPVCAVDIPTGVDGSTGAAPGVAVKADLTVTFFRKKPGHLLMPGKALCGDIWLADIGIPPSVLPEIGSQCFENAPTFWLHRYPWPSPFDHKYARGHLLVYGGACLTGAARLAARGAQRIGAGLVTVAAPARAWPVYAAALTSIMVQPYDDTESAAALLSDPRKNAVVLGPGAGLDESTKALVLAALATQRAIVIDADGLSAFRDDPKALFDAIDGPCVLTPHEGEFSRLFSMAGDKLRRARAAAQQSGAVVLLKGSDTVIASPDGRAVINANAPATLATGGTGDVLSGLIGGLLAQGMPAFEAACAGCWIHAQAAVCFGHGLIADDLPDMVPKVLHQLASRPF